MSNELKSYTRDLYGFWDWASENLPTENEDVNELVLLCKQFLIYGNLVDRVGRTAEICGKKAKDFKYKIAEESSQITTIKTVHLDKFKLPPSRSQDNSVEKFESGGDELVKGNRFIICMCSLNLLNGLSLIRENFSNTELAIIQKQPLNSADLDYDPNDILNGFIEDTERNLTDSGKS
ncbi:hypothetical protein RhiirA1_453710 [Rhizophagus irregularis]|nr:hypothetical protein RhiirA1_453710 [Rhizophagus irregularis]PKY24598.1 hypothetical protein RhiirB3_439219 [Rhizophagus irregularis]